MAVDSHLKLMALDMACQRLAQRVRSLAKVTAVMDPVRLAGLDKDVAHALEILDPGSTFTPEEPPKKAPNLSLLWKMVRGKDLIEEASALPSRPADAPPSKGHTLVLRGQGECVPPPDLLGFLSAQRKTGLLEVVTPTETFTVEFEEGDIVHSHVNRTLPGHRLGDLLVSAGAIERDQLEAIRKEWASERLGEVLLAKELVTREQLVSALQNQIQLLFNRLFVAQVTRFTFWSGPPMLAEEGLRLNTMALILEGARVFDEGAVAV